MLASPFVAGDVSHETSPAAKSEEKGMFPQATPFGTLFLYLPEVLTVCNKKKYTMYKL